MDNGPQIKAWNWKVLEENVGNALQDRGKGKVVQNKTLDAQEIVSLR